MRNFTEQENNLIKELVAIKKQGLSYIQELQVARILRTKFSFFALKWTYRRAYPLLLKFYQKSMLFARGQATKNRKNKHIFCFAVNVGSNIVRPYKYVAIRYSPPGSVCRPTLPASHPQYPRFCARGR